MFTIPGLQKARMYVINQKKNSTMTEKEKNQQLVKFTSEILEVFERNEINGHIVWKK